MVTNKKEIVYNNIERFAVIVAADVYKGVQYVCLNQGIHPSCYVMCSQEFLDKHLDKTFNTIDGLHVHGGITYTGNHTEPLDIRYTTGTPINPDSMKITCEAHNSIE